MAPTPEPFWGRPTATLDWCEINYEISPFIAEFWNTISNLGMIIPPLIGMYEIFRHNLERKYILTYASIIAVGIGSWAFHMTLLYSMQLLDELPMVLGNTVLIYQLSEIRKSSKRPVNWTLITICAAYFLLFCGLYLVFKNPVIHQVMYGMGVLVVLSLDLRLVNYNQCRTCTRLLSAGFFLYTFGFGLWNIDNQLCSAITDLRTNLPRLLKPWTQLHAWWHLLAGYATYLHVLFIIHARGHFFKPRVAIIPRWFGISVEPSYRVDD